MITHTFLATIIIALERDEILVLIDKKNFFIISARGRLIDVVFWTF